MISSEEIMCSIINLSISLNLCETSELWKVRNTLRKTKKQWEREEMEIPDIDIFLAMLELVEMKLENI